MTIPTVSPALPYLDIMDPAFHPDGAEVRAARAAHWCARTPMGFAVLRYDKLTALLADRRLRQGTFRILSAQGLTEGPLVEWLNSTILSVEGDDHTRLRRLVSRAFTPRAVSELRPRMSEIANELVDRFPGDGPVDFMEAFADPYPARVICELLGVPREQHDAFRGWANDLGLAFSFTAAANVERIEAALEGLHAATDALLAQRRARPTDDLLSALIAAEADGSRLSTEELRTMVTALLFAGQDTTRHQLGNAIATFLCHPDQWTLLARQPELAAQAVEEVVRVVPTVPLTSRIATEDLEIDGVAIPADSHLALFLATGNTDQAAFGTDADRFDITASRQQQLTFGGGIHYCLGAYLARIEMVEALPLLARRLGPIEPDGDPTWRPAMGIAGPVTLPIRFRREAP
ncbi:cytochrome P450 [Pseudonocardia yunnanensis]|uniref:Cytochrome P450 n=1 Tax=Pseudonocardia yunnanensis TaxID=58107 RepID=A0ABW4F926_9PSEU